MGTQAASFGHRYQEVEVGLGLDPVQQLGGEVFRIGQDQGLTGLGIEDVAGQLQQFLGRGRGRARRGAGGETEGLARIDVDREKSLSDLGRPLPIIMTMEPHMPLAEAAHPMGIDGQQTALEVA